MRVAICPTVTAFSEDEYAQQIALLAPFAKRLHIDLMDGEFAPTVSPGLHSVWWPHHIQADIHLMYRRPMEHLHELLRLRPRMVIIHAEADVHHMHFAAELHKHGIRAGLALLQETPVANVMQIIHSFDHALIFSGHLGYHGGAADLGNIEKAQQIHTYYDEIELGWDGGISADNAAELVHGGIRVLNVGGYIHKSHSPKDAYATLKQITRDITDG